MTTGPLNRSEFDQMVASLVGRRISSVAYWDVSTLDHEPPQWDYESWHHAVMGVELSTDGGPFSLLWTNTFGALGIEVLSRPMAELLSNDCYSVDATSAERWSSLLASPIRAASTHWERFTLEYSWPRKRRSFEVPSGIRIQFGSGVAWVIAGIPQPPNMQEVFVPGDEIMIIFDPAQLRDVGFPEDFVASSSGNEVAG